MDFESDWEWIKSKEIKKLSPESIVKNLEWLSQQKSIPETLPSGLSVQQFFTETLLYIQNTTDILKSNVTEKESLKDLLSREIYPDSTGR